MAFVKGIFLLAALLVAAATTIEGRHPPQNRFNHENGHHHGHGQGHHFHHPAVVPETPDDLLNPEEYEVEIPVLDILEGSGEDETIVKLIQLKQRRYSDNENEHKHEHEPGHGHEHNDVHKYDSEPDTEENVDAKRQQTEDAVEVDNSEEKQVTVVENQKVQWVTCDLQTTPLLSCYDCYSRMRCTQWTGGKVIPCYSPVKPYCNNGICSAVPGALCDVATSPRK